MFLAFCFSAVENTILVVVTFRVDTLFVESQVLLLPQKHLEIGHLVKINLQEAEKVTKSPPRGD